MKRVVLALLLAALLLAGCTKKNGITVNTLSKTISDGNNTYTYTDETVGDNRTIVITYPDGNTYTWTQTDEGVEDQYSGLFQVDKFKSGETLVDAIVNPGSDEPSTGYIKKMNSVEYLVDPEAKTVTVNGYVFPYTATPNSARVRYPNGAVCSENGGSVSWTNADEELIINNGKPYANCYDLLSVIPHPKPEKDYGPMVIAILAGFALICIGSWETARPYDHWYWQFGWRYKNAEPSDEAIGRIAAFGIIQIVMGVIVIIVGFFL